MSRTTRSLLLVLYLALGLSLAVPAKPQAESQAAVGVFRNTMTLVRAEFIYETPPGKLLNGAFKGMEEGLKEKDIAFTPFERASEEAPKHEVMQLFENQFYAVTEKHPELLQDNWLVYKAVEGMLAELGDDYTVFMDPDEYRRLKESMSGGNFGGLGIYIELDKDNENWLTVVEPIEDTPATKAGLKAGDVILRVDGKSTRGVDVPGAQKLLRGTIGSKVVLTIRRQNSAQPFDVELTRARIHVNSVRHKMVTKNGRKIGYVRLRLFGEDTSEELESAMNELEQRGAEGFIMDLRNNGGGYIVAAVDVCSKFLPTGSRVVSVKERGAGDTIYRSRPNMRERAPLVLLVNQFSASASEITAAALQDYKRAHLIGVKTFGKGSVQKIFPLPDGSALKVTTAHYHTPTDKDINKVGVEPDTVLEFKGKRMAGNDDNQLVTAAGLVVKELEEQEAARQQTPGVVRVSSVAEELRYYESLGKGTPEVVSRRVTKHQGGLVEEVTIRFPDGSTRTIILDQSEYLGQ